MRWAAVLSLALAMVGGAALFQKWRASAEYGTGVGEQQLVVLDDGTRMTLNTATRVRVDLGSAQRTANVDGGEALFEVAKDARRPFVVRVAGAEVVAPDAVVAVRFTKGGSRGDDGVAVTLISGQATLQAAADRGTNGLVPDRPLVMQAGERVRLVSGGAAPSAPSVDRPDMDQVVAWKRSEAVFDGASLSDAVAEMNRYSRTPIVVVGNSAIENLRVSGLYRTGDNAGFARAVATLHGLNMSERQGRLELTKAQ
jgi:transmembrane sensor